MYRRFIIACCSVILFQARAWQGFEQYENSERDIKSKWVQQEVASLLSNVYDPIVYLEGEEVLAPLFRLYASLEARRRGLSDAKIDHAIVISCVQLEQLSLKEIWIANTSYKTLSILRAYTYNHTSSMREIEVWWRWASNQTRDEWARAAVDQILQSSQWDDSAIYAIQESTMNYRVHVMTREEFMQWWNVWRDHSPREWALDTLEWALKELGTGSSEEGFAFLAATRLLPKEMANELENRVVAESDSNRRERGETFLRWLRDQDRYDPLSPRRGGLGLDSFL